MYGSRARERRSCLLGSYSRRRRRLLEAMPRTMHSRIAFTRSAFLLSKTQRRSFTRAMLLCATAVLRSSDALAEETDWHGVGAIARGLHHRAH
ncbi:hypothetical protein PLICRDRAFT_699559, partial [Plicaturopsis crispa FD-325 SS-3]